MPANKYALLRYRIIDRCLSKKNYPNKEDLRQACEDSLFGSFGNNISGSTIEKDLWAMRNESDLGYYAPIKYSKAENGYFYEDEEYSINDLSLNETDLEAIKIAAQTLNQFKDNPIFQQYENAIDKIVNRLKVSPDLQEQEVDELIQFERTPVAGGTSFLSPLFDAVKHTEIIEVYYKKYSKNEVKKYELHPYLLKEYRNRWYLISFDPTREKFITLGLERIEKIQQTDEFFTKDSNFSPDRFFKYCIGITELDSNPQKVILSFNKFQANYIESQPIHQSQKIISRIDNEVQFEFEIIETYELIQTILGYGSSVKVLEPESLKNRVSEELKNAIQNYI